MIPSQKIYSQEIRRRREASRMIWICVECASVFELDAGEQPLRDEHRNVYCSADCREIHVAAEQ